MAGSMPHPGPHARLAHAVPGRLRVRLHEGAPVALLDGLTAVRAAPAVRTVEVRRAARSVVVHYDPDGVSHSEVLEAFAVAGVLVEHADQRSTPQADGAGERPSARHAANGGQGSGSTLRDLLIGPPPKLDRRFAESLALSAVSLVGARQVGMALGGGTTLPAYFAIWLTLRRLTGMGRRR